MTDTSSSLSLPYIQPSQAQKHVTHNEALRILDVLVQLSVLTDDQSAPPALPDTGARYIVGDAPTGDWSGHARDVAVFDDGVWRFFAPRVGWRAYVAAHESLVVHDGSDWMEIDSAELQDLDAVGIGMTASEQSPFSAKLNAALWSALYDVDGGTGSLIQTLNKQSAADDLGFVFQRDFATRGLIGMFGDNNLRLATTVDGTTFRDGLIIDSATGMVSQPQLPRFKARTNFDNFCAADSWTRIAINEGEYNDQSAFDAATGLFTAPVAGTYLLGATLVFKQDSSDQARMGARLLVNGTTPVSGSVVSADGPHVDQQTSLCMQSMTPLSAGDTVELQGIMRSFDGYAMAEQSSFWGFAVG